MEDVLTYEKELRLFFFIFILVSMLILEHLIPYRSNTALKKIRWVSNLGMVLVDVLIVRLVVPFMPIALAIYCQENQWGLLPFFDVSLGLSILITIVVLDFVIYWQHRFFHVLPFLWRLHQVHHTDIDLDTTSAVRFHPIEILISMGVKIVAIGILGAPAFGVIAFEIILNGTALFNHSNIKLPFVFDKILRFGLVTPDMHRVHHSTNPNETNLNFGFNMPWWDRLFGTYQSQPKKGHLKMTIGLKEFREEKKLNLLQLLVLPFRRG